MCLIGAKWKGSIIYHLKDQPVRLNDSTRVLGGSSKKMLEQRLKALENQAMMIIKVIGGLP